MRKILFIILLVTSAPAWSQTKPISTKAQEQLEKAEMLDCLADSCCESGDFDEGIRLATEALQIKEQVLGKEHPDYADALNNIAVYYFSQGNPSQAISLVNGALQIYEKIEGKESEDYASTLSFLFVFNQSMGNFDEAIRIGTEALQVMEKTIGKEHPNYAAILNNLAGCNASMGNFDEAIRLGTEALHIYEAIMGKESPDYALSLNNLAGFNSELGNYSEAIRLGTEALQVMAEVIGKEHPDYASGLDNLANFNYTLGNYSEAARLSADALQIRATVLGKETPEYATNLNNLASYNYELGNYDEAIRLGTEALQIREQVLGKEHPDYATSLGNLANYNQSLGNYNEAISLETEALQIREKTLGKEHPDCAISMNNLANYYASAGNYDDAIRLGNEALKIYEATAGKEHPNYTICLSNLALFYEHTNLSHASAKYREYADIKTASLLNAVQGLSREDRNSYWEKEKRIFERRIPQKAFQYDDATLITCAYDASLLSKGFLLGAETETKKLIQESGDDALIAKYDEMVMTRMMLDQLLEKPLGERDMDANSLRESITALEREVMAGSKAYGDLKKNMSIKWQDVQGKLGDGDIAVEFLSFPTGQDSIMYMALTLKKGYGGPRKTVLFEEKQLKSISKQLLYSGNDLYNLVWKPLEKELKGTKNIYFSPTGELYNINIESIPSLVGKNKKSNYWRLSSTRQLAYTAHDKATQGATVYGGMKYNAGMKTIEADSKKYPTRSHSRGEELLTTDNTGLRGGWSYLPGTLTEATEVNNSMSKSQIETNLYTDAAGTEASFKALDGAGRKYLHVATHGFYYTDRDTVQMKRTGLGFAQMGDDRGRSPKYVEDKSLTRSGLLFSGCNNKLTGKELPVGVEDGILFAKEIANLDLRGMDLVTLSACETGLGDITGEGVFGLQRAFKKAGAQSILMSLWKVDDDATQLFMTRFYENYLSRKMTKSESLKDAQQYVRTFDGGIYKEPAYWAAFILLDAI